MLDNIRAFLAVVDTGSVHRAAEQLRLTQPAVTRRVQNLEGLLGVTLLDRRTKPPKLTAEGKVAYERARRVLAEVDEFRQSLTREGTELAGELRLGVAHGAGHIALSDPIAALRRAFPRVRLEIHSGWTPELLDGLWAGRLDAAVVMLPRGNEPPGGLEARQIGEQRILVVAPRALRLPARPALAALSRYPWVLNPDGCGYRNALRRALESVHAPFSLAAEIHGPEIQLSLIAAGLGLGLVPRALLKRTPHAAKLRIVEPRDFDLRVGVWIASRGVGERFGQVVHGFAAALEASLART